VQIDIRVIGKVVSPLVSLADAPRQPDEGAPAAWLVFERAIADGLRTLKPGDAIIVITWLDRANRDVLTVHPRGDRARSPEGVFSTRSPDRPNPIGLHEVTIEAIEDNRLRVHNLEAIDGTPILDVKPVLNVDAERR
jgi:tRNA-Thr(GGU) m(6)t(6)A37 methyltransferase TsaA